MPLGQHKVAEASPADPDTAVQGAESQSMQFMFPVYLALAQVSLGSCLILGPGLKRHRSSVTNSNAAICRRTVSQKPLRKGRDFFALFMGLWKRS